MNWALARPLRVLALVIVAAALTSPALATTRLPNPRVIPGLGLAQLPEDTHANSVAIGPDGTPWLATFSIDEPPLFRVGPSAELSGVLPPGLSQTSRGGIITPDSEGKLWLSMEVGFKPELVQFDSTTETVTQSVKLPGRGKVMALTIGPEGEPWFTREEERYRTVRNTIGTVSGTGALTEWDLPGEGAPESIATGPDDAIWFTEAEAGRIGRFTPGGKLREFELGRHVHPDEIVAGPDGALWFSENGRRDHKKAYDRIGRITSKGEVTQFPIPFGEGTGALAPDSRGLIWFGTWDGQISSISTASGAIGGRGCLDKTCETPIAALAVAPDGTLWVAGGIPQCGECGGGTQMLTDMQGTKVAKIPAGALKLAGL